MNPKNTGLQRLPPQHLTQILSSEKFFQIRKKKKVARSYWVVSEIIADFFIQIKPIFLNTRNEL